MLTILTTKRNNKKRDLFRLIVSPYNYIVESNNQWDYFLSFSLFLLPFNDDDSSIFVSFSILADKFAIIIIKNMIGKRLLLLLSCISTLSLSLVTILTSFLSLSFSQLLVGSISFRSENWKAYIYKYKIKKETKKSNFRSFSYFFVHFTTYDWLSSI